jgi:hypothetical protein
MSLPTLPKAYRQVFWLSYQPRQESIEDYCFLLQRVFGKSASFFGSLDVRDGADVYDCLLFIPSRTRISSVPNKSRWQRHGARGAIVGLKWPEEGVGIAEFIERWAAAVRSRPRIFGHEKNLRTAYRRLSDRNRERKGRRYRSSASPSAMSSKGAGRSTFVQIQPSPPGGYGPAVGLRSSTAQVLSIPLPSMSSILSPETFEMMDVGLDLLVGPGDGGMATLSPHTFEGYDFGIEMESLVSGSIGEVLSWPGIGHSTNFVLGPPPTLSLAMLQAGLGSMYDILDCDMMGSDILFTEF